VCSDAADNVAIEAEVVDLLVCMASAAAHSPRCNIIFNPFPLIFDPDNPKKQILSPERPDYALVRQILDHFLSIEQLTQAKDFLHLKAQLTKSHPLAYPLLQWIIASNRAHIVKLHETKHITSMKTQHQYLLLSAPPEKEERFRQLKRSYSSLFAFHGSAIENWHSILRHGLKNATGTKLQLNGAAYGPGIYLSPQASISFGYSFRSWAPGSSNPNRSTKTANNKLLRAQNVHCIALCEVIDLNLKRFGSIWVQPNEDCVVTRFLFVYTENASYNEVYHNSENSKFLAEVKEALNFYNNNRK
jgi:poly [ADP-ribose] polymerase 6/8